MAFFELRADASFFANAERLWDGIDLAQHDLL
jgi:hypothetical protein